MPTLVIRDVSPDVHRQLKERARAHHRSLTKEVVAIIEESLSVSGEALPPLVRGAFPLTQEWLQAAIREGRE